MNLKTSEIKEELQELKKQLKVLSTIYNGTRDLTGLLSVDDDNDYTFISSNQATFESNRRLGITNSNFLDIKLSKFLKETFSLSESQLKLFREKLDEAKASLEIVEYESSFGTPDNRFIHLKIKLTPITDQHGLCEYILFNCADVTEMVTAQKNLEKSEKLYRSIFESIQDVFFRARMDWTIHLVSPSISKLLGAPISELEKINFKNWVQNPEDLEFLSQGLKNEEQIQNYELVIRTKTKENKIALISCWLSEDPESQIRFIEGVIRDVTELKKAELEALEKKDQLFQSSKLATLGTLVSGLAHEINNPNNNIMFNASIIRKFVQDLVPLVGGLGKQRPNLVIGGLKHNEFADSLLKITESVIQGTHRIKNIVSKLKDYSRQESGLEKKWLDVNEVIGSALEIINIKIQKATDNFEFNPNTNLPKIWGNFSGLEQVVVNLVDNACQALQDKSHYIKISTLLQEDKNNIEIHVEDNGEGIKEEIIHQISDPFFTTHRKKQKMGLGLSIANAVVLDHGGKLDFFSHPGQITVVRVSLPIKGS